MGIAQSMESGWRRCRSRATVRVLVSATLVAAIAWTAEAIPPSASAAPNQSTLSLSLITGPTHEIADGPFDIAVVAADASDLGAFELDLALDGAYGAVSSVTPTTALGVPPAACDPGAERCSAGLGPLGASGGPSIGAYSYGTGAGLTGAATIANLQFVPSGQSGRVVITVPACQAADTGGGEVALAATGVTFDIGVRGNCNDDPVVDAGDISAMVLEIFDGDGSGPLDARASTFFGSPVGCNSNRDGAIDAGDISCAVLLIFGGSCG